MSTTPFTPPTTHMSALPDRAKRAHLLADPALTAALGRFVRPRVPASEVDDIVQATLADALASSSAPESDAELVPWIYGIARNKIVDFFRRTRRELPTDGAATEDVAAAESGRAPAEDLLRWAKRELPEGDGAESTLEWMLREGQGEKLETIAAEANVPAPRVRQRVARLRKHFRARWAAQLAAVAALVAVIIVIAMWLDRKKNDVALPEPPMPTPSSAPSLLVPDPSPQKRAEELRRSAFDRCDARAWQECIDGLDAAKDLDPAGDADDRVKRARRAATDALAPPPAPPTPAPKKAQDTKETPSDVPSTGPAKPKATRPLTTTPSPAVSDPPDSNGFGKKSAK